MALLLLVVPFVTPAQAAQLGTVTISANTNFSPEQGLLMASDNNVVTVVVPITNTASLSSITISTTAGSGAPLEFETSDQSGSGAGTWSLTGVSNGTTTGSSSSVTFSVSSPTVGTATFSLKISGVPRAQSDRTDTFTIAPNSGQSKTATLRRYSLRIAGMAPPLTTATAGESVDVDMTVVNLSTGSHTLTAAGTALGGTVFSSTGTEGAMPTMPAGASRELIYTDATITSSTGTFTMTGEAKEVVFGTTIASAPTFSKNVTVSPSTNPPPAFSSVGTIAPNNAYSPAGLIMDTSGNTFTVAVTISALGSGTNVLSKIKVVSTESVGRSPLVFQTSGSSGSGAGGTWTASSAGSGEIFFNVPSGVTTGTVTFTVSVASVPRLEYDGTDSVSALYVTTGTATGGSTAASNTLKRYSFEITGVSPPATASEPSATVTPVMTIVNHTTASRTLTDSPESATAISGSAFSSIGTESSMPSIASGSSGTVTYTNATITSTEGTRTILGNTKSDFTTFDGSNFISVTASAPQFSKNITVATGAVDEQLPAFSAVGAVTPTTNSFSPAGFIMGSSGNALTVPVTISGLGTGSKALDKIKITVSETATGGSSLVFQTSGSSGTGAGGSWSASSAGSGQITFEAPSGVTTGTATFTVSVSSVPALNGDGTDTFTATYVSNDASTGGATAAANTLKRHAFEITRIEPPVSAAEPGATVSPVMTVANHALVSRTLNASSTSLSGTAFSSAGTEGSMPSVTADATATVTYTNATITSSTGTKTIEGDAQSSATFIGLTPIAAASAPHFSKSISVQAGAVDDTAPTITSVGLVTPGNGFSPAGFVMDTSGNDFTIPLTITPGTGVKALDKIKIVTSEAGSGAPLVFQTSGSSGTGAGGTWTASSASSGEIVFSAPTTVTSGTVIFTVKVASVPRLSDDGTDSFTASFISEDSTTGGSTAAANTVERHALEITSIDPPGTAARPGISVDPVLTVANHALASKTLTAADTSIAGTAFSSTGSEGTMPTIAAGESATVTYTGAVTTGSTGTKTVEGNAAAGATSTAPSFSKSVTIDGTTPSVTITSPTAALTLNAGGSVNIVWSATEAGTYSIRANTSSCSAGTQLASASYTSGSTTTSIAATSLAEGANTILVCVTDAAGNTGSASSVAITKDSVAPETAIDSAAITGTAATFRFSSPESSASFECSMDSASFGTCSSPKSFTGLLVGSHTFRVRAVDVPGNADPSPESVSFVVITSSLNQFDVVQKQLSAGGTVTTDDEGDGATLLDPFEVTLTTRSAGPVTIQESPVTGIEPGWILLFQQAEITAPAATASNPLTLVLRLDASMIPTGLDLDRLGVFKGGSEVTDCSPGAGVSASPDPCVSDVRSLTDGDVEITVRTSTASAWKVGVSRGFGPGNPRGCTIIGTAGNDILVGTPSTDVICGKGGDSIDGGGGDDVIYAGAGDDVVVGGLGDDEIRGGKGADEIDGNEGNDRIFGGPGDDSLSGSGGEDFAHGGAGKDALDGGAARDDLRGGDDDDLIRGNRGGDVLRGDRGNDILSGGEGPDVVLGGGGDDRLDGGLHHDTLRGGTGQDVARGRKGNDILLGGDGDDTLFGHGGRDTLSGGKGFDLLYGGDGTDNCRVGPEGGRRIRCE